MSEQTKKQIEDKIIDAAVKISLELIDLGASYILEKIKEKKGEKLC